VTQALIVVAAVFLVTLFLALRFFGPQTRVPPQSPTEWCMATTALLTTVNGGRHDTFEGHPKPICQKLLGMWWDVGDRASLLETINWLRSEGHRAGRPELLAWDFCRAVSVLRWGIGAGFLTREEAEPVILGLGQELQQTYGSWRALAEGYLAGRTEWAAGQGPPPSEPALDQAMARLLDPRNGSSPWQGIPWGRPLA
jgi:hypothetical protein